MMTDQELAQYVKSYEELWMTYLESQSSTVLQFVADNRDYLTEFITSRQQGR